MSNALNDLILHSEGPSVGDRMVLIAVASKAAPTGLATHLSVAEICRMSGLKSSAAYDHIRDLDRAKLLTNGRKLVKEAKAKGLKRSQLRQAWLINVEMLRTIQFDAAAPPTHAEMLEMLGAANEITDRKNSSVSFPDSGKTQVNGQIPEFGAKFPDSGKTQVNGGVQILDPGTQKSPIPISPSFLSPLGERGEREEEGRTNDLPEVEKPKIQPSDAALDLIADGINWRGWKRPNPAEGEELAHLVDAALTMGHSVDDLREHCDAATKLARHNAVAMVHGALQRDELPMLRRRSAPAKAAEIATGATTAPVAPPLNADQEAAANAARGAACEALGRPFEKWGPADRAKMCGVAQRVARTNAPVEVIADAIIADITGMAPTSNTDDDPAAIAAILAGSPLAGIS